MLLFATLGGIGALIFWGVSDYYAGKSGQKLSAEASNLILQFAVLIVIFPILIIDSTPWVFSWSLGVVAIISLLFTVAYVSFIKALALGPVGIAAPLSNSYALITLLIAIIFLGVSFTYVQVISLLVISVGAIMLAFDRTTLSPDHVGRTTVVLSLLAAISWGIGFALIDIVTAFYGWQQLLFLIGLFMVLYAVPIYIKKHRQLPNVMTLIGTDTRNAWLAGGLTGLGALCFYLSTDLSGTVAIPAVIAAGSPLITSFMAFRKDGETLSAYKRLGAVLIALGVVLLNI
jgi:drug/metabolite transporter (DMT)-like permease